MFYKDNLHLDTSEVTFNSKDALLYCNVLIVEYMCIIFIF